MKFIKADLNHYLTEEGQKLIENFYILNLKSWSVLYEELYLDTEYGKTYLLMSGDPHLPPLILLHGANNNSVIWKQDMKYLSSQYRTICIDLVGDIGRSRLKKIPKEFSEYGLWLLEVLEQLKIRQATFMGVSFGGALSIFMAYSHPEKVKKVFAFVPAGVILKPSLKFMAKSITTFIGFNERKYDSYIQFLNGGRPVSEHLKGMLAFMYNSIKAGNTNIWSKGKVLTPQEIKKINVPCYCFLAEYDPIYNARKVKDRIQALNPNFKVRIIANEGHLLSTRYHHYLD